jgi:hypothetical protein
MFGKQGLEHKGNTMARKPIGKCYVYVDGYELKIKCRTDSRCGQRQPKGSFDAHRVRVGATGSGARTSVLPSDAGMGVEDVGDE